MAFYVQLAFLGEKTYCSFVCPINDNGQRIYILENTKGSKEWNVLYKSPIAPAYWSMTMQKDPQNNLNFFYRYDDNKLHAQTAKYYDYKSKKLEQLFTSKYNDIVNNNAYISTSGRAANLITIRSKMLPDRLIVTYFDLK